MYYVQLQLHSCVRGLHDIEETLAIVLNVLQRFPERRSTSSSVVREPCGAAQNLEKEDGKSIVPFGRPLRKLQYGREIVDFVGQLSRVVTLQLFSNVKLLLLSPLLVIREVQMGLIGAACFGDSNTVLQADDLFV